MNGRKKKTVLQTIGHLVICNKGVSVISFEIVAGGGRAVPVPGFVDEGWNPSRGHEYIRNTEYTCNQGCPLFET